MQHLHVLLKMLVLKKHCIITCTWLFSIEPRAYQVPVGDERACNSKPVQQIIKNKFRNLFLDISPISYSSALCLPPTNFSENEYIHIIFDDHKLHALLSLETRYALDWAQEFVTRCVYMPLLLLDKSCLTLLDDSDVTPFHVL